MTSIPTALEPIPFVHSLWGDVMIRKDLPPPGGIKRWVVSIKVLFINAVENGVISREEFLRDYSVLPEEFDAWIERHEFLGVKGLKAGHISSYRAVSAPNNGGAPVYIGDLVVDAERASVAGVMVYLTPSEHRFLQLLALKPGTVFSREMIYHNFYGAAGKNPTWKIIDVRICKLRKKLAAASGGKQYIETVWGRGYRLRDPAM